MYSVVGLGFQLVRGNATSPGHTASVPRGHCLLAGCSHVPEVKCVVKGTEKQETLSVSFFSCTSCQIKIINLEMEVY